MACRQRLINKYRDLTNRELRLGRHRRAAYIFAHLLRDFSAAANALKQGRFYREAATLYQERLKDVASAARCLEEGGLLIEAVDLYVVLHQFEKAGDLRRQLGHDDDADALYRKAIEQLLNRNDTLGAARLLDAKLHAIDEALVMLAGAWPSSAQAAACLEESFRLLGREGRHDDARRLLGSVGSQSQLEPRLQLPLAQVLANVATEYADHDLRPLAADATRVVVGRHLPLAQTHERSSLVSALTKVTAEDRLLPRDANRYLQQQARKPQIKPKQNAVLAPPPTKHRAAVFMRAIQLPAGYRWQTTSSNVGGFYALGIGQDEAIIYRGDWTGMKSVKATWEDHRAAETSYRIEDIPGRGPLVAAVGGAMRRLWLTSPPPRFSSGPSPWTPQFLPSGLIFDLRASDELIWVLHADDFTNEGNLILSGFSHNGDLRSSYDLHVSPRDAQNRNPLLTICDGYPCVTLGASIQMHMRDQWYRSAAFGSQILSLVASAPHTRIRLAACFAEGGAMVWPPGEQPQPFGKDLIDPVACILREGLLIVVGRQRGSIYQIGSLHLNLLSNFDALSAPPATVFQTHESGEFAILYGDGLVRILRVP